MPTRGRRALRLVSSSALAILTLAGLAVAGAGVTNVQANTAAPSRAAGHLPTNRPTAGGSLVVAVALGTSGTVGSVDPQLLARTYVILSVAKVQLTCGDAHGAGPPFCLHDHSPDGC